MNEPQHIPYAGPGYDHERRGVDDGHLKALVICTYIWGGLAALFSLIPIIHVGIGVALLSGAVDTDMPNPPPPFLGWMFIIGGSAAIILGEIIAGLNLYSAYRMSRRRGRIFSIVIAGINCLSIPLGTLLGIFTIIVLSRESVRRQYDEAATLLREAAGQPPSHPAWRQ